MEHSQISPSAMGRTLNCPGWMALAADAPRSRGPQDNEAAEFGTFEHDVLRDRLRGIARDDAPIETIEATDHVLRFLEQQRQNKIDGGGQIYCSRSEQRIVSTLIPDFGGTPDYFELGLAHDTIPKDRGTVTGQGEYYCVVVDYKSGRGRVEATHNAQLLAYAALIWETRPQITRFELAIVQPRVPGPPIDVWVTDHHEVRRFHAQVATIAERLHQFRAGSWCRYCPALSICETAHRKAEELAAIDFATVPVEDRPRRWAETLANAELVKGLLDSLPPVMLDAMRGGAEIPGWKAVEAQGNRRWKFDETELLRQLARRGVGKRTACEYRLRSPHQLEKLIGPEKLDGLTERPDRGLSVVPESDKRTGVAFDSPEQTFGDGE